MNKLREKTFYTIFLIISLFLFIAIIFINFSFYEREYSNILLNLNKMSEVIEPSNHLDKKMDKRGNLDDRIIMDYNFYTIILDKNNNIIDKISHNNNYIDNTLLDKIFKIINTSGTRQIKINCLYLSGISYKYNPGNYLIIVDTTNVRKSLLVSLFISVVLLTFFELISCYFAKKITIWITKPVEESFNKQKDFIANASHELKTPLAVIVASTDCIRENKQNEKYINNIKLESENMNNLITRLLDLSKSEQDIGYGLRTLNNLSKIISKRILVFESLAFENDLEIDSEIESDIMFCCLDNDINELIDILIDNAIKHGYKNSKIKVNLFDINNEIVLEVINNGDEISSEDYDKIFERFYRSDLSRNRENNRYGLGLSIAKNIVDNYNGVIRVISENNYTTFRVILRK